jgi:uncharacterized protein (TIGR02453 family)
VLEPAQALVVTLGERLKVISQGIIYDTRINGSGSLMRIHRDTRFSKDKTPYNPYVTLMFWEGSGKKTENPGFGMRFDSDGGGILAGMVHFPETMLSAYRRAVLDDELGEELVEVLDQVRRAGDYRIGGEHYKRMPQGLPPDHPRADLLRYAALHAIWDQIRPADLTSPVLVDLCYVHCANMAPIQRWLVRVADSA